MQGKSFSVLGMICQGGRPVRYAISGLAGAARVEVSLAC